MLFTLPAVFAASTNIFENQVIPVSIHNILKSLDQIWLQFEGYLYAQSSFLNRIKQKLLMLLNGSMNSKKKMNSKVFFRNQTRCFERNKIFCLKVILCPPTEFMVVNILCWNFRDAINILFENGIMEKQNLSKKEKP